MKKEDCKVGMKVRYIGPRLCYKDKIFTISALSHSNVKLKEDWDFVPLYGNIELVKEETMNKDKLRAELKEVEAKLAQIQEELAKPEEPPKALHLKVLIGKLCIRYGRAFIGYISEHGECHILNRTSRLEVYNEWREAGMPIDSTGVEWRGKDYYIDHRGYLDSNRVPYASIYDFESCTYMPQCHDTNIQRFTHNNKPIGF